MQKILIIEDNKDMAEVVEIVLKRQGYTVYTIYSVGEVFPKIEEIKPDLILLDVYFQGVNRGDLCKQIKLESNQKNVPVILFSASPGLQKIAEECGAVAFIEKPFDIQQLVALVNEHIAS